MLCCIPNDACPSTGGESSGGALDPCLPADGMFATHDTLVSGPSSSCPPRLDAFVTFDHRDAAWEDGAAYYDCCSGYPSCSGGFTEDPSTCTFRTSCGGQDTATGQGRYVGYSSTFVTSADGAVSGTYELRAGQEVPPPGTGYDCVYTVTYTRLSSVACAPPPSR